MKKYLCLLILLTPFLIAGSIQQRHMAVIGQYNVAAAGGWHKTNGWTYKMALVIQNGQVDADLDYFPVLLTVENLPAGATYPLDEAQDGGGDLRFHDIAEPTGEDDGRLPIEIVTFNTTTDVAEVYVTPDQITDLADTTIYVFYGANGKSQPAEDAAYGKEATWDENAAQNYAMVQHFTGANAAAIDDSTANDNDCTADVGTPVYNAAVLIGQSIEYDGATDRLDMGSGASVDDIYDGGGTTSAWINADSDGESDTGRITEKQWMNAFYTTSEGAGACTTRFIIGRATTNGAWQTDVGAVTIGADTHVAVTYNDDDVANDPILYVNGVAVGINEDTTPVGAVSSDAGEVLAIGNEGEGVNRTFDGHIDELRLSITIRSADWIATLYNNTNAPNTFAVEGAPVGL